MKRLIPLLSFLLIQFSLMLSAQNNSETQVIRGERPPIDLNALTEDAYEKGTVLIKFNENSGKQLEDAEIKTDEDGNILFGFKNVDALCKQFSIGNAAQLFSMIASKNGFTTKHKAWGFDRWYKLKTDDQTDIIALVQAFQKLDEIEIAEPEYKKVPVWQTDALINNPDLTKTIPNSKWTPSDPLFDQQWHYHNTGQSGGQSGADIDLLNAWDIEKGNPNVIVAIIDDGIDFNHPDLAANMWAGIGYNFVDNMATVIPGFHGTHVAGTVAAVSNNNTGVAGIAGGSGSGDGVRLMSCQVFRQLSDGSYLAGGFEAAFVYAADHGAAISQNSWTYGISFTYNSALSDAIDYFEINGGGIAINGGVSVFAAGNSSSAVPHFPAVYPSVLAVAATDASDQKSSFSNFGYWIDISAPGSLVYSTDLNNSYSFASGTSMACPHVSGVAALVASRSFGQLTANEVKEIILYSTDDHYLVNPDFAGKLGTGRLNANKALLQTIATLNSTPNVSNFQAVSIDLNTNFLSWTNNSNNDEVLIAWSTQAFDGSPTDGVNYAPGQALQEGVTVLFNGFATEIQHQQLNASSHYYYRIWAKSSSLNYASGRSSDAITQSCFPEEQCTYTFRLTSIGNSSWADSYMTVEQGGRTIADLYKFCGLPSFDIQVNLCENELFQLIWHPGTWGDLMGIEIIGPYGNSIFRRPPQSPYPNNHPVLFEGLTDCSTPSCFAPENIEISNHQSSEVTIDWTITNNQSVVNLEYGPLGYQQGNGTVISGFSESPYTLTGLSSATRYEVRLQSDCGNNDLSFWSLPIYFETACTNFDLPVYEDFSNIPYRELPLCWDRYGSTEPPTENWAVWGHDHVWLHHRVGSHANLITPVINQNLNQVRMYFDLTWDNYTGNLQIGTSQHINDDYIFTSLESIPSRLMYDFEPAEKRVIYFESYNGSDQQIAFRYGAENAPNASWVFLDNIVIEEVPLCPEPYDLNLLNNTETTAELAWKQSGTVQEWEIKLGEIGFNPDAEGLLISDITSNPYEIQTLSPASFYQVYIRSSCGQDHSIWSEPIIFSSSPGLLSLPHIENFNDCPVTHLPPGWANIGIGMHNAVVLDGWGTNQSHGVLLKNAYFESTSILVAPEFDEPVENIIMKFEARSSSNLTIEVGVLSIADEVASFQSIEALQLPSDLTYRNYAVSFVESAFSSGNVAIKIHGGQDDFNTLWLDDFEFLSVNSCIPPENLQITEITALTATVEWEQLGNIDTWDINYGQQGFNPDEEGNMITGLQTSNYTITGLEQLENYAFFVRAHCAEGTFSDWVGPVVFNTPCGIITPPFFEDFESIPVNAAPKCWAINSMSVKVMEENAFSGQKSLRLQIAPFGSGLLISPEIDVLLNTLQVKFRGISNYQLIPISIQLGAVASQVDFDSFEQITEFDFLNVQGQPWQAFGTALNGFTGNHQHLAFLIENTTDQWIEIFIDDLSIETLPVCPIPFELSTIAAGTTSTQLSWQFDGITPLWDVVYGVYGFDPTTQGTLIEQIEGNQLTIDNLNHSSFYEFYVRGYCDGTAGEWSSPGLFRTDCGPHNISIISPLENDIIQISENSTMMLSFDYMGCFIGYVTIQMLNEAFNPISSYYGHQLNGTGNYDFIIPLSDAVCSGLYSLKISFWDNLTNYSFEEFSEAFQIENNTINLEISSPQINKNFLSGRTHPITWNSSTDQAVDLFYSLDDGSNWETIATGVNSQCGYQQWGYNHYQWNVPTSISGTYSNARIKTALANDPSVFATSEVFTITSVYPVVFNSPQQGDVFLQGDDIVLDFDVVGDSWINIYVQDQIGNNQHLGQFYVNEGNNVKTFNSQQMSLGYGHIFNIQHQSFGDWFTSPFFAVLEELPNCNKPSNLVATNIGYIDADLEWQPTGNESSWNISYGYQGFTVGEGDQIEFVSTNTWKLTNLYPNSMYDIYVQAHCDENNQSAWEGPMRIQTKALPEGWNLSLNLPYEMELIAQLQMNQLISTNPDDILGAFIGNMCVGVGNPNLNGIIHMNISSYNSAFDPVQFKIWDSQLQQSCDAGPGIIFEHQTTVGSEANPWIIHCMTISNQSIAFGQGYTWFSLNVNPGSMTLNNLFSGLSPCYDDRVIGQTSFALYTGNSWLGSLTTLGLDKMYRMKLCTAHELNISGEATSLETINLAAGYTWLAYQPQECQSVSDAMAELTPGPSYDDRVIGQSSFALFTGSTWLGSLTQMCPGAGYVIKLANPQSLTYPTGNTKGSPVISEELLSPTGAYPAENMQHTMMVVAELILPNGMISLNEKDVVYAFINGEIRGMAQPMAQAEGLIFMSIGSNEETAQSISFMVWLDGQQTLLPLNETLNFEPLAAIGDANNPFIFSLSEMVGLDETTDGIWFGEPYPNPFTEQTIIPYRIASSARLSVKVFNNMGQLLKDFSVHRDSKGNYDLILNKESLQQGIYNLLIQVESEKNIHHYSKAIILNR